MATPCSDSGSPQWRNPVNRRNWISSKEVHRLCSSGSSAQSPTSPSDAARAAALQLSFEQIPPLVEVEHWYKKVACCHLESLNSGGGNGQGVIVCLGTDVYNQQLADILGISTYPAFALITCHHIITGRSSLRNWRLVVSGLEMKKFSDKLDSKKFEACKSCCGPDGVLGREEHFNRVCPFGADFTVLVLTKEFANDLLKSRDLLIPTLMPLDMRSLKSALQSRRFYAFKRDQSSGVVRAVELNVHKRAPPTEDEQSVEGEVNAYKEMCILRYDKNPEVLRGDSGAGIFLTEGSERLLLGIHKSTEVEDEVHTGIAIHSIFHAIASEFKSEVCGIIPSLSQLRDAIRQNGCKQWRARCFRNVNLCLEMREGTAMQASEEGNDLPLSRVLKIFDFLLKQDLLVLSQDSPELSMSAINLLTAMFNFFHRHSHGHTKIGEELTQLFPGQAARDAFNQSVCEAAEKVYKILKSKPPLPSELVESCFKFWLSLSYFPHTYREIFTDSHRIGRIGNIRNSKEFQEDPKVQKVFGDICLAYQLFMRDEWIQVKKERDDFREELDRQREAFERERDNTQERWVHEVRQKDQEIAESRNQLDLERQERIVLERRLKEVEQLSEERQTRLGEVEQECDQLKQSLMKAKLSIHQLDKAKRDLECEVEKLGRENRELNSENEKLSRRILHTVDTSQLTSPPHRSTSTPSFHYPTRPEACALSQREHEEEFWDKDMADMLRQDLPLRQELGKYFEKNTGSESSGTWEHLLDYLKKSLQLKMNAAVLETKPVGDILLNIVQEWSKIGGKVTVEQFCNVSKQVLNIGRVEQILYNAESKWNTSRNSNSFSTPQLGDSLTEHV